MRTLLANEGDLGGQIAGWSLLSVVLAIGVAALVIYIAALVGIVRSENYAPGGKAIWALAVLAFPFLGPLFWFVWGKNSRFTA
ncbi:PLD nuclease N-terminal domain-containing protein [Allokutzneria sp. NRRL B-24872]|uniref:PLD nuclease N-terminal domain-containing protein n=1 Tax=Allokutzneria sp. NRRL B-24872 TaxID=1137961 RepID=UPI000A36CF0C|nr:PLD nuclease N-terminal domain-containing protein [Allokutzneria sp. NRRL B-24872]